MLRVLLRCVASRFIAWDQHRDRWTQQFRNALAHQHLSALNAKVKTVSKDAPNVAPQRLASHNADNPNYGYARRTFVSSRRGAPLSPGAGAAALRSGEPLLRKPY